MKITIMRFGILGILSFVMIPMVILGQNTDEICRMFANNAFSELGNNCAGTQSNEVCYGYGDIISTFHVNGMSLISANDYGALLTVGDQTPILVSETNATLENLSTIELIPPASPSQDGNWGIAYIQIKGDFPRDVESNIIIMSFGDATIENAVFPENAFVSNSSMNIELNNTPIFTNPPDYPQSASEQIGIVNGTFSADAMSVDGNWVRVTYEYETPLGLRQTAWVMSNDVSANIESLPILGADDMGALQSFFVDINPSPSQCANIPPSGILVQSPDGVLADLVINGIHVQANGTVYVDMPTEDTLRFTMLAGVATIRTNNNPQGIVIAVGQFAITNTILGDETNIGLSTELLSLGIDGVEDNRAVNDDFQFDEVLTYGTSEAIEILGNSASSDFYTQFQILASLPSNIMNTPIVRVTFINPSGVGSPNVMIIIDPPSQANRIQELCASGLVNGRICSMLR